MMSESDQAYAQFISQADEARLLEFARGYSDLMPAAQTALRAEFARRGLEAPLIEDTSEPEYVRLKTIARYRDLSEAIVARTMLESSGMLVWLYDENLVRLDWQVSNFIGGIRLQVDERDEADARALLAQPVPTSIKFEQEYGEEEFRQPRCPVCRSTEITFEGASRSAAIVALYAFAVPLPPGAETWSCGQCGARWQETDENMPPED